jgi:hypothetical protein
MPSKNIIVPPNLATDCFKLSVYPSSIISFNGVTSYVFVDIHRINKYFFVRIIIKITIAVFNNYCYCNNVLT